jgi:hypothetical protein
MPHAVPPVSRICAKQPTRTSRWQSMAEYLINNRPLRSSSIIILMHVALLKNDNSRPRTASNRHHSSVRRLRSFAACIPWPKSSQAVATSSTGGAAASKEGLPVASEPAACCRCPTTASLWAAVRAWRSKLLHRKPFSSYGECRARAPAQLDNLRLACRP